MKSKVRILAIAGLFMLAGSMTVNAQGGRGGFATDTNRLKHMQLRMDRMKDMPSKPDSTMTRGMGHGRMMAGYAAHNCIPCCQKSAMHQRHQGQGRMVQHQPGHYLMENIPGLTEKQKKEIEELRTKQMEEMQKMRDEQRQKASVMRDAHRKAVLNILTAEQKKWVEENFPGRTE